MLETVVYDYFAFGFNYNILRRDIKGINVRGAWEDPTISLQGLLDEFFEHLSTLNLQVTLRAADDLRSIRRKIASLPDDAMVEDELAEEVKTACKKLDVTLDSELQLRTAFVVTPGRFGTHHLLEEPSQLLSDEAWARLPDIAVFDFISACRALALGLATAAAFHIMRCLEAILRDYYTSTIKRNRIKKLTWGPLVEHLRKKQRDKPPKALLDHLDNIRVNFRNPTQHSEARYELEEAQDLLSVSIDSINRMARD